MVVWSDISRRKEGASGVSFPRSTGQSELFDNGGLPHRKGPRRKKWPGVALNCSTVESEASVHTASMASMSASSPALHAAQGDAMMIVVFGQNQQCSIALSSSVVSRTESSVAASLGQASQLASVVTWPLSYVRPLLRRDRNHGEAHGRPACPVHTVLPVVHVARRLSCCTSLVEARC